MPRNSEDKLCGTGGHCKKFCFTYEDYADLFCVSVSYIRHLVSDGRFDPNSLKSVIRYYLERKAKYPEED